MLLQRINTTTPTFTDKAVVTVLVRTLHRNPSHYTEAAWQGSSFVNSFPLFIYISITISRYGWSLLLTPEGISTVAPGRDASRDRRCQCSRAPRRPGRLLAIRYGNSGRDIRATYLWASANFSSIKHSIFQITYVRNH